MTLTVPYQVKILCISILKLALSFIVISIVSQFFFQDIAILEMSLSVLLACANHEIGWFLKNRAMDSNPNQFLKYAVVFNACRLLCLLVSLLFLLYFFSDASTQIIFSFFVTYMVFLSYDVMRLYKLNMK